MPSESNTLVKTQKIHPEAPPNESVDKSDSLSIPVLLFGSGITGIGVIRNLSRAGIQVFAICPDSTFVARSRFCRTLPELGTLNLKAPNLGIRAPKPAELKEFLNSLSLPRAVLMAGSDDWAAAIAALDEPTRERFPVSTPTLEVIETFTDKWRFAQLLQKEALPHPSTELLFSMDELRAVPENRFENRFLKPLGSQEFGLKHKVKAFLIQNKTDALNLMDKGEKSGSSDFPILLQEYIPGPPTNHYFVDGFVDSNGEIRALFARQRLRMYPPLLGNSTLMVSVPVSAVEGAVNTIRSMFKAVSYRGIFSAEFKLDDRDKLFKIIEVNARPWWYVEFAARSGVDVCKMAYQDALGLPISDAASYESGLRCVYLPNDFKAFSTYRDHSLFSWLKSWVGARETVFAADDPWPGIDHIVKTLYDHFRKGKH